MTLGSLCVTVSLGTVPSGGVLKGLQFTIASFGGRREYWWRGGGDTGSTGCEAGVFYHVWWLFVVQYVILWVYCECLWQQVMLSCLVVVCSGGVQYVILWVQLLWMLSKSILSQCHSGGLLVAVGHLPQVYTAADHAGMVVLLVVTGAYCHRYVGVWQQVMLSWWSYSWWFTGGSRSYSHRCRQGV